MAQVPVNIEIPNYQLIQRDIEYPIDIPNYVRNPTTFEIGIPDYHKYQVPIEKPEFNIVKSVYKPKDILIPIEKPNYQLVESKIDVPVEIPKIDFYENRIKMDIDVMKYDFRDISVPIDIPRPNFNIIPKQIDIEIPVPNFRFNNNVNLQQQQQNDQLTYEGINQDIQNITQKFKS
ncbi:uncharacterized protein GO595_006890 [Histomonas meleagridis]|uniref:uncharacterized protein n=1 Tax=Histomonas meleagridis TaxID=135588 RepID=UPI00355A0BDD|nr:hypothetical protein GO595_006890 [Histomonas meleagridis]